MKIKKFNENLTPNNDQDMISFIGSLMAFNIVTTQVKYTDDIVVDSDSIIETAEIIFNELKNLGVDFDLLYATKKYNL
jgi:hypothetical protein